ncbi:MAG: hypothetical protein ACR2LT_05465 [Pyrinomonadaceae bacterium]
MNSEELEISLRTEFENYLKNVFAEMRQEISDLQAKIETELENHKTQLDGVFKEALNRADAEQEFDAGFKDSVLEHLRLARDEGARITATAFAEAEDMEKQNAAQEAAAAPPPSAGIKELHAAINDISSKTSQAEILKTLVQHASQFAPRGAFFIVKNEHFVGWRTFGSEDGNSEEAVREVFLPVSSDSILSEAVRSLATVESNSETYSADAGILDKLEFGAPDKIFAIPLVARGRGVAVLYADYGAQAEDGGGEVNIEALETMVHVAGLTVEILASSRGGSAAPKKKIVSEPAEDEVSTETAPAETGFNYQSPAVAATETSGDDQSQTAFENENRADKSYSENNEFEAAHLSENENQNFTSDDYPAESGQEKTQENSSDYKYADESVPENENNYPAYQDTGWNQPSETFAADEENYSNYEQSSPNEPAESSPNELAESPAPMVSAQEYANNFAKDADERFPNYAFEPPVESEPAAAYDDFSANAVNNYQTEHSSNSAGEGFDSFVPQTETYTPVAPEVNQPEYKIAKPAESFAEQFAPPAVSAPPVKSRLSERNVDLPIEVSEDERRLHNDARRVARLLVAEIKLYNEQKVKEGREESDLYERLREAIDRSREMYDKRVQPPVAAKFDYFHYEIINTLAEGDGGKLGGSYPGASV